MSTSFDGLISKVMECGQKTVSVAVAQDSAVLEAVRAAKDRGIANAVLVGDEEKIKAVAAKDGIDISDFEIIHEPDEWTAALTAVKLAHDGKVDMYMKGLLETKTFLKSILDKEVGLRTGNPLSHVCVFDIPGIEQLLFFTDVAFMTYPSLEDKVHIIENTVKVAHACGIAWMVEPLAMAAVAAGADGLMIEVHNDPAHAKSDGAQSLTRSPAASWTDLFPSTLPSTRRPQSIRERRTARSRATPMFCSSPTFMQATWSTRPSSTWCPA